MSEVEFEKGTEEEGERNKQKEIAGKKAYVTPKIVHPKMKNRYLPTLMSFQTHMLLFSYIFEKSLQLLIDSSRWPCLSNSKKKETSHQKSTVKLWRGPSLLRPYDRCQE